ncbi:unnamed protein product [Triticum turgidum subsp. durum]|uniref:Uncharacterized protein n=1 Tax=Triticum turgidum subsp. durum TaxID=4567 RepID=A0A9R0YQE7_TRITD|nr:unnamed protein product [Triticum turgidum subsp. durum]
MLPARPRLSGSESDLSPTPLSERTMTAWDLASLWIGLVVGVPSYYLAGSLVDLGMSALSWIGGRAVFLLLPSALKTYQPLLTPVPGLGAAPLEFACFLAFWAAQLGVIMNGMEGIRKLERYSAPVLIVLTSALLTWAYVSAGGFGRILSLPPRLTGAEFWKVFFPALTANIGFWATVAINIPDFARYARSQADQVLGQAGLPVFMGMFTFAGLAVTSSTEAIFGHIISDPIELLGRIGVILADHYIVRRTALDVDALYSEERESPYYFQGGFNVAAMVAMAAGVAPIVPGFLHKVGVLPSVSGALVAAYNNAWFVSFFVAGTVYCLLCRRRGGEVKYQSS